MNVSLHEEMVLDTASTANYYTNQLYQFLWPIAVACFVLWWKRHEIRRKWLFALQGSLLAYLVGVIAAAVTYPYFTKLSEEVIAGASPRTIMIASAVVTVAEIILATVLLFVFANWLSKRTGATAS